MKLSAKLKCGVGMLGWLLTQVPGGGLYAQESSSKTLQVKKCNDFSINGKGTNPEWEKTSWHLLTRLDSAGINYASRFKILYAAKGIYVLFDGKDNRISTDFHEDFQDLYNADVFEVFFQPDTSMPIYLEYEINALSKELVLLIPNLSGRASGWLPFHYNMKSVQKKVAVVGDKMESGAAIKSWSAELFFPYEIFDPLLHVPPVSGTVWHANFYRLDYDSGSMVKWSWAPIIHNFHEYKKFGSILFE